LISKSCTEEELFLKGKDFYENSKINFQFGQVVKVNPDKNQVVLKDDSIYDYDALLIASGGKPIILPWEGVHLKGISTLYTLDDAKEVASIACDAKNAVIIGGGSIAMKVLKSFVKLGLNISIVEKSSHLWPIGFDRKISRILEKEFLNHGVQIFFNDEVVKFNGNDGKVTSVTLKSSREIPTDLVIVTIGIRPNVDFLQETNIKVDKGIIVDKNLRTNLPNVFAAGDIAQIDDPLYQVPILHPTWGNAKKQGNIVAKNMAGNNTEYNGTIPIQTIKSFGFQAIAAGITHSKKNYDEISWISFQNSFSRKFVLDNDKLIGVLILGRQVDKKRIKPLIKKAIFNKVNIGEHKTDILSEDFDYKLLLGSN